MRRVCAQTPAPPSDVATWCTWSCGCCRAVTAGWMRSCSSRLVVFPPFTAPHLADRCSCVCVCFRLLLMHEALSSHPRCASDAHQHRHTPIQPFFSLQSLSAPHLRCPGSSLTFANETHLGAEASSRRRLLPLPPPASNDKRQRLVPPRVIWKVPELFCVKTQR